MTTLTKAQKKRLAREAVKLAAECAEGTAPEFGVGAKFLNGSPCCVVGHLQSRANSPDGTMLSYVLGDELWWVFQANDLAPNHLRQERLVFPLMALADALESA